MYCWCAANSFAICSFNASAKDFSAIGPPVIARVRATLPEPRRRVGCRPTPASEGGGLGDLRTDRVWLLRSRWSPFAVPGALELSAGRLLFTLDEAAAESRLGWLEERLGVEGLGPRLEAGEIVVVFDHRLSDCTVSWPLTAGGGQLIVEAPGARWVVSYEHAAAGRLAHTLGMITGRGRARDWKRALAEAGA